MQKPVDLGLKVQEPKKRRSSAAASKSRKRVKRGRSGYRPDFKWYSCFGQIYRFSAYLDIGIDLSLTIFGFFESPILKLDVSPLLFHNFFKGSKRPAVTPKSNPDVVTAASGDEDSGAGVTKKRQKAVPAKKPKTSKQGGDAKMKKTAEKPLADVPSTASSEKVLIEIVNKDLLIQQV